MQILWQFVTLCNHHQLVCLRKFYVDVKYLKPHSGKSTRFWKRKAKFWVISWGQAPFPIFVDFKSIIFCYKDQIWQFFFNICSSTFFSTRHWGDRKAWTRPCSQRGSSKRGVGQGKKSRWRNNYPILNILHGFSSEAPFYKAPPLFEHCIAYSYIYFTLVSDKVWNQYKRWNDDSRLQS